MSKDEAISTIKAGNENNGLVVFMDALGTKGSWLRNKPEKVIESYTNLSAELRISEKVIKGAMV